MPKSQIMEPRVHVEPLHEVYIMMNILQPTQSLSADASIQCSEDRAFIGPADVLLFNLVEKELAKVTIGVKIALIMQLHIVLLINVGRVRPRTITLRYTSLSAHKP